MTRRLLDWRRVLPWTLLLSVVAVAPTHALDGRSLHVQNGRLTDGSGREVTLRGVNARVQGVFDVTFSDGRLPLEDMPTFDEGDAARMQAFGFNLLRLPINWSGVEPTQGTYDKAYLDRINAVVKVCHKHDIVVLLDFHQDAFSKEIGQDGAPRWVLDLLLGPSGYPYEGGPLTDLSARRFAPSTQAAFRGLFANQAGVQDAFAAAVAAVAKKFKSNAGVFGYEVLNEPWAAVAGVSNYESAVLSLNTTVAAAIRLVDKKHFVAFEPDTIRNQLDQAVASGPFPDERAIYAPHIYTDVFNGANGYASGDPAELAPSMQHADDEATQWGTPLLVGEWGIDPTAVNTNKWITDELNLQDQYRASSTFWLWEEVSSGHWGLYDGESSDPTGERIARTTALSRPYARAVPGTVLEHTFDDAANTLRLRYQPQGHGKLELFIPLRRYPTSYTLLCNGQPIKAKRDPVRGIVKFGCGKGSAERLVELAP
jgi:endoglycosylceramidase